MLSPHRKLTNFSMGTVLRHPQDGLLISALFIHGVLISLFPSWLTVGIGMWWLANTVAHQFIHRPFFCARRLNRLFSVLLSISMGVPQTLWRNRHLAHHSNTRFTFHWNRLFVFESSCLVSIAVYQLIYATHFLFLTWIPGLLFGLVLCQLQGHFEHIGGGTTSCYGRWYNLLFFNDGYHVEHHEYPSKGWWEIIYLRIPGAKASSRPPVLRWLSESQYSFLLGYLSRFSSTFLIFVFAKWLSIWDKGLSVSYLEIPFLLRQDLAIALIVAVHPWAVIASIIYTGVNLPILHVLSTPITSSLLSATGAAIGDSFASYFHFSVFKTFFLYFSAVLLFKRVQHRGRLIELSYATSMLLAFFVSITISHTSKTDISGFYRNPLFAFARSLAPSLYPTEVPFLMSLEARFPTVGKDLHSLKAIARERNVVHIVLESTGAQYLTMYGARENPMPFLEKIAARGLVFENAYTTYPESIKGLFATLTGFYPALDTAPKDYERLQPPSLPSELARNGYRTALFHSARFAYLGMNSIIRNRGFQTLQDAGDISGEKQSTFGISDERQTVERMLDWIDESSREQNFYLAYLPAAGHHPYGSPDEPAFSIEDPYGQYLNALRHTDTSLEILINGLKSRGLYDNTLFVIHGDHGEAFGQKPENFVHSLFIYEENVHVPFIIFGEGLSLQGRSEKVSSLVNIPATVLDLVGLYTKNIFQGTSLISEIEQTSFFFTDYSQSLLGLRDGKWKFVLELDTKIAKLFDLSIDERETKNIAESHPQLTEDFRQRILQWAYRQQHELGTLKECTVKEFADCRTNSVTLHPSHARM